MRQRHGLSGKKMMAIRGFRNTVVPVRNRRACCCGLKAYVTENVRRPGLFLHGLHQPIVFLRTYAFPCCRTPLKASKSHLPRYRLAAVLAGYL